MISFEKKYVLGIVRQQHKKSTLFSAEVSAKIFF